MTNREKVEQALRKVGFFRRAKAIAIRRKGTFLGKVRAATAEIERQERWLRENRGAGPERRNWHEGAQAAAHQRRRRAHRKLTFWRKRYVWARNRDEFWTELLARRRRRLRSSERVDAADFRNEMTGSHEYWTLTDSAQAVVAIGVEVFGLWVSSTYRPETPGSHHSEDPTRGADLAGEWEDMIAFQRWLFENHLRAVLELFGPDNGMAIKNGQSIGPLAEGSFLEDLHDSHDHAFIIDPGYPLAYVPA